MGLARKQFEPGRRLTRAESAALAREVLERARASLHQSAPAQPTGPRRTAVQVLPRHAVPRIPTRSAWQRLWDVPGLESAIIAAALALSGAALLIQRIA